MANIGLLLDLDQGHIFPALGVAKKINNLGHVPHLLGIPDIENYVNKFDFQFYPVFERVYPRGFLIAHKEMQKFNSEINRTDKLVPRPHIDSILLGEFSNIIKKLNLDLLIVTYSLSLETLVLSYKYPNLKIMILTTWLRDVHLTPRFHANKIFEEQKDNTKLKILSLCQSNNIEKITAPLDNITEIITCPKEFELPNVNYKTKTYHLNSCIRDDISSSNFVKRMKIPKDKIIIYASIGTQSVIFLKKAEKFCKLMTELMALDSSSDFFLILSVGSEILTKKFISIPGKIEVVQWAPQLEVLRHSSLVISHGGLGTIKESVSNGVPLLIIPMINDEFDNGKRVNYHQLGISTDLESLTSVDIAYKMRKILVSNDIHKNLTQMKKVFNKDDMVVFKGILDNYLC